MITLSISGGISESSWATRTIAWPRRQESHSFSEGVSGGDIQRGVGFVQQQGLRLVNQGAGDQNAPHLPRGEIAGSPEHEILHAEQPRGLLGLVLHPGLRSGMHRKADPAEKSRQDGVAHALASRLDGLQGV